MSYAYTVPFQGGTIACKTELDAVDVKLADRVLSGLGQANSVELLHAASVLERYRRRDEAQRLRTDAAARLLAESLLAESAKPLRE